MSIRILFLTHKAPSTTTAACLAHLFIHADIQTAAGTVTCRYPAWAAGTVTTSTPQDSGVYLLALALLTDKHLTWTPLPPKPLLPGH